MLSTYEHETFLSEQLAYAYNSTLQNIHVLSSQCFLLKESTKQPTLFIFFRFDGAARPLVPTNQVGINCIGLV